MTKYELTKEKETVETKRKYKIGIPRGLFFYEHGKLWERFFKELGFDTMISPPTNRAILDLGVKNCSSETCLPVKVFHGHVLYLKDKADYIFIPRYISYIRNETSCPKFCGLPDMVSCNLKRDINVIEIRINKNSGENCTRADLFRLSKTFDIDLQTVISTYNKIVDHNLNKAAESLHSIENDKNSELPQIAVIGHPYMTEDPYLSMKLIEKLEDKGYRVLTIRDTDSGERFRNAVPFSGRQFWSTAYDTLGGAVSLSNSRNLKGLIYLTPFACGLDSIVTEFIERRLKNRTDINYMKLTVDEHTGEAGFDTRVEAFLDMLNG